MEVSYKGSKYPDVRPDGLCICTRGKKTWSVFIEAKAEKSEIRPDQIQDYVSLAALVDVDAVVSISNEFARRPDELPYHLSEKKRKNIQVLHFAWADIRTLLELTSSTPDLSSFEAALIQHCLDFFWSDGSGIFTYDAMPAEWPDFVEAASTALGFNQKVKGFTEIVYGWQQERRDLCSKLTHLTHRPVELRHRIGVRATEQERTKADRSDLADEYKLSARYYFPETKVILDVTADLRACRVNVSLDVAPPENKGAKAITTWLSKLLSDKTAELTLHFDWPGRNQDFAIGLHDFLAEPTLASDGRKDAPRRVQLLLSKHGVRRFKSRKLFIEDVEDITMEMVLLGMECGWVPH